MTLFKERLESREKLPLHIQQQSENIKPSCFSGLVCDIPAAAVCAAGILCRKSSLVRAQPVFSFQVQAVDLGLSPLVLTLSLSWGCSSNVLTTPSQEVGSFRWCYSLATLKSRHPKTHANWGPHICISNSVTYNHWNYRLDLLHCQRFKPKKWLWTKVFIRFTTKISSVWSKQNPYGFKYYFLIFLTKALALFYGAKKLWRSNLLRHCNHKKKKINWKMSLLYNLPINRWKNSNIIYLSTQKCLPWSQANSLWCLIWLVANFLSVMEIQWKLGRRKN